ncbi:MAG: hypothetical protein ACOCWM_04155, partial [Cyclobacteriaceae bacterium]
IEFDFSAMRYKAYGENDSLLLQGEILLEVPKRWMSRDPLAADYPYNSPYCFVSNDPINRIDPDGRGDYYAQDGTYLGNDDIVDNKTYTANPNDMITSDDGIIIAFSIDAELTDLNISHDIFRMNASVVYGESSIGYGILNKLEMFSIASVYVRNKLAFGKNSSVAKKYRKTKPKEQNKGMQVANAAIINVQLGGHNYSNGATGWDGMEQALYSETNDKFSTGRFELHMNTIGWTISDEHYKEWKKNIGSSFKAPQKKFTPNVETSRIYYMPNTIRYKSTAVHGRTIFWLELKGSEIIHGPPSNEKK